MKKKPPLVDQHLLDITLVPQTPQKTSPMPNSLARTHIFSPRKRGARKFHDSTLFASPNGITIKYSGYDLDMADQDVFLLALHMAANAAANDKISINRAKFLKELGKKSAGQSAYLWLEGVFTRLAKGVVEIDSPTMKVLTPLMGALKLDKITNEYCFTVPPETIQLFSGQQYGYVDLEKRQALSRRINLAKWLQSYAVSHARGLHRVKVLNLKNWCGYSEREHKFRESLTEALDELVAVKVLASWKFYNGNSHVEWFRIYTPSSTEPLVLDTASYSE